jgi:hypothetical protein
MKRKLYSLAIIAASFFVVGCQTYADRPFYDPLNLQLEMQPREKKRVQVAPSEQSFALQFRRGTSEMSDAERRAAIEFLKRRIIDPSNEVFVDFGLFQESTDLAHARRTSIAELLTNVGSGRRECSRSLRHAGHR